jgi:transcriptional regulator with XRE-family HTH domain
MPKQAEVTGSKLLGSRLREFREYLGQTQAEFGDIAGVGASHVSGIELGQSSPTLLVLEKLIIGHQMDGRWLFGQIDRVEDADLSKRSTAKTEDVLTRLSAIEGRLAETGAIAKEFDPIAYAVKVKPALKDLVAFVKDFDTNVINEIKGVVFGYVAGRSNRPAQGHPPGFEDFDDDEQPMNNRNSEVG